MSRDLRIEYENACYHVMNRGAARQKIFRTKKHYQLFLDLLQELHSRFHVVINAYCLMPNHYHLFMRTPRANISDAERHLNSIYTRRFNISCRRDGPLFRGRFKAILVESDKYLLRLSRYIHLNPVKANMVEQPEDFKWSSYQFFLEPSKKPSWLSCDETLNYFGDKHQIRKYQRFVKDGIDNEIDTYYKKAQLIPILGSENFIKTVTEKYLIDRAVDTEITQHRHTLKQQLPTIEQIFQVTADYFNLPINTLKLRLPNQKNIPRAIAIYLAIHQAQAPLKSIANFIGNITYSAVGKAYQRFRKHLQNAPDIARQLDDVTHALETMSDVKT